jgi:hypothetical protein
MWAALSSTAQTSPATEWQKLLFENEFVRVLEINIAPGVREARHSHARGVTVALSDYDSETIGYPDRAVNRRHTRFGETRWAEPVTHESGNTGTTPQRVIRIELRREAPPPAPAPAPPDPLDSLVACKETQKLIFENAYVRVIEERVPPGVAQPKHRHARGVLIPLADSEVEAVDDPGGQVARRSLRLGVAGWRDPVIHAVRNAGKTELLNVRVELKGS